MGLFPPALAIALAQVASGAPPAGEVQTSRPSIIQPATIDDTLEVTGDSVDARVVETRMTVGVLVNGQGPFRFLVDSGADRSVVGSGVAQRLRLPQGRSVTLHGVAGASVVGTVKLARLAVGRNELRDFLVPALPERHLGGQGLLGIDALAEQRVMLDFDAKTITVGDAVRSLRAASTADEIIVTARRRNGQLILTQAEAGRQPIAAVIDTGAQVTIGNRALYDALFRSRRKAPETTPTTLISVTGETVAAEMVTLPQIRIGGLVLEKVTLAFSEVPPFALFGLSEQPALLLGTDVLGAFRRVTLDFRKRKVRFLLRR